MALNLLALDRSILRFMKGPKDWKVISLDFASVEPTLIAHFSQCPNYMNIYGPNANPNHDIYPYVGMAIPQYRELFGPYYDLNNPTKEGTKYIKDHYASERSICKTFHLSAVYGAFPPTIHAMLEVQGIHISIKEVEQMHRNYWQLFKAVKSYERTLQAEWRRNGGYIISGRGTPIPMNQEDASKHILNRMIQKTAHQYLMRWVYHLENIVTEMKLQARPLLLDLHDSTTWTCPPEEVQAVDDMLQEGLRRLNEELQLTVVIKGATKVGDTLRIIE